MRAAKKNPFRIPCSCLVHLNLLWLPDGGPRVCIDHHPGCPGALPAFTWPLQHWAPGMSLSHLPALWLLWLHLCGSSQRGRCCARPDITGLNSIAQFIFNYTNRVPLVKSHNLSQVSGIRAQSPLGGPFFLSHRLKTGIFVMSSLCGILG